MIKILNYAVILLITVMNLNNANAEDYCRLAMEELYKKDSDLISIIKINTNKTGLYSSSTEISKDCQNFSPFISVKDPDVLKADNGFCAVLPASEIQPNLCSLHVTLCITEHNCQSIVIKLITKDGRYVAANPAYYEMSFQ